MARRCDLLAAGFDDAAIAASMARRSIFRVRHGWYARAGTSEVVLRAVRVGGRVTGVEALRLRGLFLPRPARLDVAVPRNAAALRSPTVARQRLAASDPVGIHWINAGRNTLSSATWLVSEDEALLLVLNTEGREVAVAACDGLVRYRGWDSARLDAAFRQAALRTRRWRQLVDGRADSWGETGVRLRLADAGIAFEPQARVPGVGVFDGRVAPGVFVEVDGAQHDEAWAGDSESSFERDHAKDLGLAILGARSIRITYAMYAQRWDDCVAAIRAAIAVDEYARVGRTRGRPSPREN